MNTYPKGEHEVIEIEDLVAWREVALGYREIARMFRVRAAQADRKMCSDPRFLASVDARLAEIDRAVRVTRGGGVVALPTEVPDFGSDVSGATPTERRA